MGAVISSLDRGLPTGALIVLVAFGLFLLSMLLSPRRGLLASALKRRAFQTDVHQRQGLMALARGEAIHDAFTLKVLKRRGFIRPDGVATLAGRGAVAEVMRDEARWSLYRRLYPDDVANVGFPGVTPIADALPADIVAELDRHLVPQKVAP